MSKPKDRSAWTSIKNLFVVNDTPTTASLSAKPDNEIQQIKAGKKLDIERIVLLRSAPDIGRWRAALNIAESNTRPDRRQLYQVYKEIVIDAHLTSVMSRIILKCTNNPIKLYDKDGNVMEGEANDLTKTIWFYDLVTYILESRWWGHSLIQCNFLEKNYTPEMQQGVELINRANVRPEFGDVLPKPGDEANAILYRKPPFSNFIFEVGKPLDLGLLNVVAPNVLYKRYGVKDWSEFLEVYGMPIREIQYDPNVPGQRQEAESVLRDQGSNSGIAVPMGSTFQLHDSAKAGNSQAFEMAAKFHNGEISKAFLLQTMTTESGSSLSQAEVHQEGEDQAIMGYRLFVEMVLNYKLKPILERQGFSVGDGVFKYDDRHQLSKAQLADLIVKLQTVADIPMSYIYETFNIPAPAPGEPVKNNQAVNSQMPDLGEKKKLSLPSYGSSQQYAQLSLQEGALTALEQELLQQIYTDQLATGKINRKYLFALSRQLEDAVQIGVGIGEVDYNAPDHLFKSLLESNVQHFSAAKSLALSQQLNEVKNTAKSFSEFKAMAEPLLNNYNVNWMRSEYNHAISAAQNGAAWIRMKETAEDFPYWEYQTVGDERVRISHAGLDGMVFRLNDPEAARIFPPNEFGCRCEGIQLSDLGNRQVSNLESAIPKLGEDWQRMIDKGFDRNFGNEGQVFSRSMDYAQSMDPATLSYKSYNLSSLSNISSLPVFKPGKMSAKALDTWYKSRIGQYDLSDKDRVRMLDYRNRPILLERNLVDDLKENGQANLLNLLDELMANPTEVWLQEEASAYKRIMLKFYKGKAVMASVSFGKEQPEQITSLNVMDLADLLRVGILIFSKL